MPEAQNQDPYATPPMKHDRTGAVMRIAIMAALLRSCGMGLRIIRGPRADGPGSRGLRETPNGARRISGVPEHAAGSDPDCAGAGRAHAVASDRYAAC